MRPIRSLHGINGRLRQHIHSLGRHYAVGHWPRHSKNPTPDQFLNELLQSGELSIDELAALTDEVQSNYGAYSFLDQFTERVLDRADDVFWAKYGRNPQEGEWAGEYRQICEQLKDTLGCYDDLLGSGERLGGAGRHDSHAGGATCGGERQPPSVEQVVRSVLQEVLGDVIPPPKKERKKSTFFDGEFTYPTYKITLRSLPILPYDYTGHHETDRRVHDRLEATRREISGSISYGPMGKYNRYVEIARIPTFLVKEVECRVKHKGPWEVVFRSHRV